LLYVVVIGVSKCYFLVIPKKEFDLQIFKDERYDTTLGYEFENVDRFGEIENISMINKELNIYCIEWEKGFKIIKLQKSRKVTQLSIMHSKELVLLRGGERPLEKDREKLKHFYDYNMRVVMKLS